ncbi:MAG: hypothetical protein E7447_06975 [Ruminococcaceae bacterium]|nr:hypothetical protein [Oscillospiraceae bacterium]
MKKYGYLPILLLAVFLMLCACAQNVTDPPKTTPSSSSVQLNSKPATKPTSIPTIIPTVVTQPTTAPIVPTTKPTTAPTTVPTQPTSAPTKPTTPPYTRPLNLDWVTDREIIPFEERFTEDVPYNNSRYWLDEYDEIEGYHGYGQYYFYGPYISVQYGSLRAAEIVWKHSMETEFIYEVPTDHKFLLAFNEITADGRWAYMTNGQELIRLELLTGEITTLATRNEGDIRWDIKACGKDTVCIFQLDADRNLRVFYRDLHSEAEKALYEGVLPSVPTDADNLKFYAPTTTQGQAYWQMLNPAYYEAYLHELNDPNSTLKNAADFPKAVQDHYNIPMLVRYFCDFNTGTLTVDFGLYDTCWNTADCQHDHWNYENTREEIPTVLDVPPVEVPNFHKPTGESPWDDIDTMDAWVYSDFGYGRPYFALDDPIRLVADIPVTEIELSPEAIYCITTEGTILQFTYRSKDYITVYSSENELRGLYNRGNYVYFIDGDTVICIDETNGTWRPILQTTSDDIQLSWDRNHRDMLVVIVRQGMYYQKYLFNPQTNELTALS